MQMSNTHKIMKTPEERFEYYKALAYQFGKDGNEDGKQAKYSNLWFFAKTKYEDLNPLTKCFLGDKSCILKTSTSEGYEQYIIDKDLNEEQKKAIKTSLENPITIIQGPPGTGKTKTIFNLLACIKSLGRTVAMVSSNNLAIMDVEEKIDEHDDLRNSTAFLGNNTKKSEFNNINKSGPKKGCPIYRFTTENNGKKQIEYEYENTKYVHPIEPQIKMVFFLKDFPIITSTIQSLKSNFEDSIDQFFDYVVIDEASLITIDLGILAMTSAKQLIVVGDDNQLPPVVNGEDLKKIDKKFKIDDKDIYKQTEITSFMRICEVMFNIKPICLKQHYRCHPAIIGFCNEYVYTKANEKLDLNPVRNNTKIATINVKCPIRLVYYEGDYCESLNWGSKVNRKQINVFLNEEWDSFIEKVNSGKKVCIMSPFKGQLEKLKDALKVKLTNDIKMELLEELSGVAILTIHKSQGSEFDVVYLLPVEDNEWSLWSQQKRLINVAVSRAKEELVVITSTHLMNPALQQELGVEIYCSLSDTIQHYGRTRHYGKDWKKEERFVQKLTDYAYEQFKENNEFKDGYYGFHKSGLTSIFDTAKRTSEKDFDSGEPSGYENKCAEVLNNIVKEYEGRIEINSEMKWKDCEELKHKKWLEEIKQELYGTGFTSDELDYYKHNRRFDFMLVIDGKNKLVIEVDGEFHRKDENQKKADIIRDSICQKAGIEVLRLPTDGSNKEYEVDTIKRKIEELMD